MLVRMGVFQIVIANIKLRVAGSLERVQMACGSSPPLARRLYKRNSQSGHQSLRDGSGNSHTKNTGQSSA
jgi:hypothetical protein